MKNMYRINVEYVFHGHKVVDRKYWLEKKGFFYGWNKIFLCKNEEEAIEDYLILNQIINY